MNGSPSSSPAEARIDIARLLTHVLDPTVVKRLSKDEDVCHSEVRELKHSMKTGKFPVRMIGYTQQITKRLVDELLVLGKQTTGSKA